MNIEELIQIPNATDANVAEAVGFQSKPPAEMTASVATVALPSGVTVITGTKDEMLGLADYTLSILDPSQAATIAAVQAQIVALQSL